MVKESIAEKNEREGKEADKMQKEKENALAGLAIMFSEEQEETGNPFQTSFGVAFRKTREAMKQK